MRGVVRYVKHFNEGRYCKRGKTLYASLVSVKSRFGMIAAGSIISLEEISVGSSTKIQDKKINLPKGSKFSILTIGSIKKPNYDVVQHVLFPTINNNCKFYIVLQLIIIVNFRASLRTKQYYWLKSCWALLALRARALAKFGEADTVPVSENSFVFTSDWRFGRRQDTSLRGSREYLEVRREHL